MAAGLASVASDPEDTQNRLPVDDDDFPMSLLFRSKVVGLGVLAKGFGDVLVFI